MLNESAIEKCAECRQTGHTSTACNNGRVGSFDLFGVTINPQADLEDDSNQHDDDDCGSIRKSKNMDIVNLYNNDKYISMDEHGIGKKKGLAWSEHEHKSFLIGLEELGRGHWRSISKNYVPTRTPTQVASHAQKYFIRMNASHEKGKRRSSLFDMPQNESFTAPKAPPTNFDRPPVPSTSENYGVRDYCYTHKGYPNKNETSIDHLLPLSLSLAPMIDFLDQKCCHPLNRKWNSRLITRSRPFVCRHRPMTQGEPKIIEVIDDHE